MVSDFSSVRAKISQFDAIAQQHQVKQTVLQGRKVVPLAASQTRMPNVTATLTNSTTSATRTNRTPIEQKSREQVQLLQNIVDDILGITTERLHTTDGLKIVQESVDEAVELQTPLTVQDQGESVHKTSVNDKILPSEKKPDSPEQTAALIKERRQEIAENLEQGRRLIDNFPYSTPQDRIMDAGMRSHVSELVSEPGRMKLMAGGMGAARKLSDSTGRSYIIKANDEDILALNNPKGNASLKVSNPRNFIEAGFEAQSSAMAYDIARSIGLPHVTPRTTLAVLTSNDFHDILDGAHEKNDPAFIETTGRPVKTKLCSVQDFVPNTVSLQEKIFDCQKECVKAAIRTDHPDFSNDQVNAEADRQLQLNPDLKRDEAEMAIEDIICSQTDHQSFFETFFVSMLLGENDGNPDNIRLRENPDNPNGPLLMFKVDNGLTFPYANTGISTWLVLFDALMDKELTKTNIDFIKNIDSDTLVSKVAAMGRRDGVASAFADRLLALKIVAACAEASDSPMNCSDLEAAITALQNSRMKDSSRLFEHIADRMELDSSQYETVAQSVGITYKPRPGATSPGATSPGAAELASRMQAGSASSVIQEMDEGPASSVIQEMDAGPASSVVYDQMEAGPASSVVYGETDE